LLLAVESKVERRLIEIEAGFRGRTGRTASDYRRIAREWDRVAHARSIRHANQILKTRRQRVRKTVPVVVEAEWVIDELNVEAVAQALAGVRGRSVKISVAVTRHIVRDAAQLDLFE
jgi:hypothetical protein